MALVTADTRAGLEMSEGLAEGGRCRHDLRPREECLAPALRRSRRGFPATRDLRCRSPSRLRPGRRDANTRGRTHPRDNAVSWGARPGRCVEWRAVIDVNLTGAFLFSRRQAGRC